MPTRASKTRAALRANRLPWVAAVLGVTAFALLVWRPVFHEDTWMYAATGRLVAEHRAVPRTDSLSWVTAGEQWQSNGWGWGLLLHTLLSTLGPVGVALAKPLTVIVTAATAAWAASRAGARPGARALAAVLAAGAVQFGAGERPQLATYMAVPVLLGIVLAAPPTAKIPWRVWVGLPALLALWVNLHSGAFAGVLLVAAVQGGFLLKSLVDRHWQWRAAARGTGLTVISFGALVINPWGLGLLTHSSEVRAESKTYITEWYNPAQAFTGGEAPMALFVTAMLAAITVTAWRLRVWRRPELAAPTALVVALTADAVRNAPVAQITAAVCLTALCRPVTRPFWLERRKLGVFALAVTVSGLAVLSVGPIAATGEPSDTSPVATAAALPQGCRAANDYRLGGWLEWARPDVSVSSDSRNDLYGRTRLVQQLGWFYPETDAQVDATLAAWNRAGVNCVLAYHDSTLVPALTARGWVVLAEDRLSVALRPPQSV